MFKIRREQGPPPPSPGQVQAQRIAMNARQAAEDEQARRGAAMVELVRKRREAKAKAAKAEA